jgi:hypothetical protein
MSGPDGGFGGTGAVRVGDAGDAIAIEHALSRGALRHGAGAVPCTMKKTGEETFRGDF